MPKIAISYRRADSEAMTGRIFDRLIAHYGKEAIFRDIDDIPQASQKPAVAWHEPMIEGAPGHGEGHNGGPAVIITAALAVKEMMEIFMREESTNAVADRLTSFEDFNKFVGLDKAIEEEARYNIK